MSAASERTVRLSALRPSDLTGERALDLLGDAAASWLGPLEGAPPAGMRRFATELRFEVGSRGTTIGKTAYVDLGPPHRFGPVVRVEVSWLAASLAPLFPVFSGWLTVGDGELRLDGHYAPPGGPIGVVADRALLHVAADRTARWFLSELEDAADAADDDPSPTNPMTTEEHP